jgi:CRP-like cAMP-binding protein
MKLTEYDKNKKMIESAQIFNALSNKEKDLLSRQLKTIKFNKDEIIFNAGDLAMSLYIIVSG